MNRRAWVLPALMLGGGLGGVLLGAGLGHRWQDPALEPLTLGVRLFGTVFLALLKALMIPLIITSIVMAMQELGRAANVARIAGMTVVYYLATTLVAVLTGLLLVQVIHPGRAVAPALDAVAATLPPSRTALQAVFEVVVGMVPDNIFGAAVAGNVLGLLVTSLIFGVALAQLGDAARPLVDALAVVNEVLFKVVRWVVNLAPLGILGLVADRLAAAGGGAAAWAEIQRLGLYAVTVLTGLGLHAFVTLPILLVLFAKRNPFRYLAGMSEALITAAGTASSAATLAVTLRCTV